MNGKVTLTRSRISGLFEHIGEEWKDLGSVGVKKCIVEELLSIFKLKFFPGSIIYASMATEQRKSWKTNLNETCW